MENYTLGIHYNPVVAGEAVADVVKGANTATPNNPNRFAIESHLYLPEDADRNEAIYITDDISFNVLTQLITWSGGSFDIPAIDNGSYIRVRIEKNLVGGEVTIEIDPGTGVPEAVDMAGYTGGVTNSIDSFASQGGGGESPAYVRLLLTQQDFGAGWVDQIRVEPDRVSNGAGGFVPRGDAAAEAGSENIVYDTAGGVKFTATNLNQPNAFPAVYDIVSVNGGTIAVGDNGNTVTMSNAITVDDVYFTDGTNSYHPTFTVTGETITFDVPLTSDDTMPNFGTLAMNVVSGPDTFSKDFEFTAPAGHTVRLLQDPIELDESSYSHGMGFTPVSGDNYFWLTNTDFDIDANNVITPTGDAPWQHTVWHLSGAGLRETSVQSGYGSANVKPTANAGPDQINVAAGATVTLDGTGSSDVDGTITSYAWTQTAGDAVTLTGANTATPSFTAPTSGVNQTLTFQLTVTDDAGGTGTDTVNVGVLAQIIPTTTITTTPQTVTIGEQFTIQADTTNAASFSWACTSGQTPNIVDASAEDLVVTLNEAGAHTFQQTVTSSTGDTATASVTLTAADQTSPVITVDTTPITLEYGSVFTPPAATAVDDQDGTVAVTVDNPVNTAVVGSYTVTYTATDTAQNTSTRTLSVQVVDTQAPTLTLLGDNPLLITEGGTFTDPGATLTDGYDPTRTVYGTGSVDTATVGSYTITYNATDSSGNAAPTIARTVNVIADYSDIVEKVAQVSEWQVIGDGKIRAFTGRSNRETFKFIPSDVEGIMTTTGGYFDFSAPYFDKLEIHMNGEIIDTEMAANSVILTGSGDGVCARLGDFASNGQNNQGVLSFVLYVGGDTRGTVIGSQSLNSNNIKVTVSNV